MHSPSKGLVGLISLRVHGTFLYITHLYSLKSLAGSVVAILFLWPTQVAFVPAKHRQLLVRVVNFPIKQHDMQCLQSLCQHFHAHNW